MSGERSAEVLISLVSGSIKMNSGRSTYKPCREHLLLRTPRLKTRTATSMSENSIILNIASTYGPILVGTQVSSALWGISCMQLYVHAFRYLRLALLMLHTSFLYFFKYAYLGGLIKCLSSNPRPSYPNDFLGLKLFVRNTLYSRYAHLMHDSSLGRIYVVCASC